MLNMFMNKITLTPILELVITCKNFTRNFVFKT